MSPLQFFWKATMRAWHSAFHMAHNTHTSLVLLVGAVALVALVIAGIHFDEHKLIALPFGVLAATFLGGIFWHAYALYREEYEKNQTLERELAGVRGDEAKEQARQGQRRQINELLLSGNRICQAITGTMLDDHAAGERWLQEVAAFVETNYPLHYGSFLNATNEGPIRGTMRTQIQTRLAWLEGLMNRI